MAYRIEDLRRDLRSRNTPLQRRIDGWLWRRRNARALARSAPDKDALRVVFAIPLISRARAENWDRVQETLRATLRCLERQSDPRWYAIICCQDRPERVSFGERVRFVPFPQVLEGWDKHAKAVHTRHWIANHLRGAGYYFALDADDLMHPDLVRYILTDDNRSGYLIEKGYMLDYATLDLAVLQPADAAYPEATHFYRSCGSSSAIWFDFDCGADFLTALAARGNHRKVVRNMGYLGFDVGMIPFHAAVYVMNHGDNLRQKRGLMSGKMKHFDVNPVRDRARASDIGESFGFGELFPGRWPEAKLAPAD